MSNKSFYVNNESLLDVNFNNHRVEDVYYNNELVWRRNALDECSWGEIYQTCSKKRQGTIADWPADYRLGAKKTLTLSLPVAGTSTIDMYIIGRDIDGNGTLTFMGVCPEPVAWDAREEGSWQPTNSWYVPAIYTDGKTEVSAPIRDVCESIYTYSDAKYYMKNLKKLVINELEREECVEAPNHVWLPSMAELNLLNLLTDKELRNGELQGYKDEFTSGVNTPYNQQIVKTILPTDYAWTRTTAIYMEYHQSNGTFRFPAGITTIRKNGDTIEMAPSDYWGGITALLCPCFTIG